jgi:DeoR/GlpR family transcriptional regulator of sugar metabolism
MLRAQRLDRIRELLSQNRGAAVTTLSEVLEVSESTVRRDLRDLSKAGDVLRTHGGALAAGKALTVRGSVGDVPVVQREFEHAEEKLRIGRAAAELVHDGDSIFLGSGSTTWQVARNLITRKGLTVVTNALNIAYLFSSQPDVTVVMIGGLLRHSELSIIGHIAEQTLNELRTDLVIMGINAISAKSGLMNRYLPETVTDRAIIAIAPHVIVVADHEKLGKTATAFVAPASAINVLVTGSEASQEIVDEFRRGGIEVILAQ